MRITVLILALIFSYRSQAYLHLTTSDHVEITKSDRAVGYPAHLLHKNKDTDINKDKIARVINYMNQDGNYKINQEGHDVYQSLERINKLFKTEEIHFKTRAGFSLGIGALLIYLQRTKIKNFITSMFFKAKAGMKATTLFFASHRIITNSLIFLTVFCEVYFYDMELGDGTHLGHYMDNNEDFFDRPLEFQVDFIKTCSETYARKDKCFEFEKQIIALDHFLQMAIEEELKNDIYDEIYDGIEQQ